MNTRIIVGLAAMLVATVSIFVVAVADEPAPPNTAQEQSLEDRFPGLVSELGESITRDFVNQFEDTNLDYVLETARVTANEFGATTVVWDEPEGVRPGVQEALRMTAEANETGDYELLPLCSKAYWEYLKEHKPAKGQASCKSVPTRLVLGLPSVPGIMSAPAD